METANYKHSDITSTIIQCYYKVYNYLGYGFLGKVYQNALALELEKRFDNVQVQYPIDVHYGNERVGEYYADLIVDNKIIIELKAASSLCEEHEAQLTNYLRATEIEVGLLLNFGKEPQFKRKAFSNQYKPNLKS